MTPEEFVAIYQAVERPKEIFYRLYYNGQGEPLFYSMDDLPGNYISIDAEFYRRSPRNIKIKDGKIIETRLSTARKLVPSSIGVACDPRDICVIVDEKQPNIKWSLKTNE